VLAESDEYRVPQRGLTDDGGGFEQAGEWLAEQVESLLTVPGGRRSDPEPDFVAEPVPAGRQQAPGRCRARLAGTTQRVAEQGQ
jgi:hypothetical protein